ncbi:phage tail assembly chaperone [Enterovirga sp. DB1703]|uniref:Phage tail assembly chaperone n=1 Tax=Enterovirga aerilata TaxID=2730920 RepID=A0A849I9G9_9HYPH|nr:rcc01693 family protein [Enterovirga sp. DB1703]NNM72647.1 phage tail assembly chaperone [Enterovirga sp. DB1703]
MSGAAEPFPWDEVLHLALSRLRWSPDALWRATPRELALALAPPARTALERPGLDVLMRMFPDR